MLVGFFDSFRKRIKKRSGNGVVLCLRVSKIKDVHGAVANTETNLFILTFSGQCEHSRGVFEDDGKGRCSAPYMFYRTVTRARIFEREEKAPYFLIAPLLALDNYATSSVV